MIAAMQRANMMDIDPSWMTKAAAMNRVMNYDRPWPQQTWIGQPAQPLYPNNRMDNYLVPLMLGGEFFEF